MDAIKYYELHETNYVEYEIEFYAENFETYLLKSCNIVGMALSDQGRKVYLILQAKSLINSHRIVLSTPACLPRHQRTEILKGF